jgi:HSP20 family protein
MDALTRSPRRTAPLRSLQSEVNRLFESVFPGSMLDEEDTPSSVWSPSMDLMESDDQYHLSVDLPGISRDDVTVSVENNRLTIRGERASQSRTEDENILRMERSVGTFYRAIRLPESVNEDAIKASFKNGVLSVTLPKTEKSRPKKIKISS